MHRLFFMKDRLKSIHWAVTWVWLCPEPGIRRRIRHAQVLGKLVAGGADWRGLAWGVMTASLGGEEPWGQREGLMLPGRVHKRFGKNTVHETGLKEWTGVWCAKKREQSEQKQRHVRFTLAAPGDGEYGKSRRWKISAYFKVPNKKSITKIEERKSVNKILILFIKFKICFSLIHIHKHLLMFHKTEFKIAKTSQRKIGIYRGNRKHVSESYGDAWTHIIWL